MRAAMQTLQIQGYSYQTRQEVLPVLTSAVAHCGGWVLDRKMLSETTMEMRVEVELRAALDLYASMIAAGLELTRSGHLSLTELCLCRQHVRLVDPAQLVTIRVEICFLEEANLHSLLMTGANVA